MKHFELLPGRALYKNDLLLLVDGGGLLCRVLGRFEAIHPPYFGCEALRISDFVVLTLCMVSFRLAESGGTGPDLNDVNVQAVATWR